MYTIGNLAIVAYSVFELQSDDNILGFVVPNEVISLISYVLIHLDLIVTYLNV